MTEGGWKPRCAEDTVDEGVHPIVAKMRLSGGMSDHISAPKLGIDQLKRLGITESGMMPPEKKNALRTPTPERKKSKKDKEKKVKETKEEKKEKKKEKKKKKKAKKKKESSSSSGSGSSSSSEKEKKKKKKKKEKKKRRIICIR